MKFFIDTADVKEIAAATELGLVDGVTTNPSLVAKSGRDFHDVLKEIISLVDGPISAEVVATDAAAMIKEAEVLAKLDAEKIVIKLPLTEEGLKATKALSQKGFKTNLTLIFSPLQALLAAKAGATYVSPFVGRLDEARDGGGTGQQRPVELPAQLARGRPIPKERSDAEDRDGADDHQEDVALGQSRLQVLEPVCGH